MAEEALQHEVNTYRRVLNELVTGGIPGHSQTPLNTTTIHELRQEFKDRMEAQAELLSSNGVARHEKAMTRIDGVEAAQRTFDEGLTRVPTNLDREVNRLEQLFDEKLAKIEIEIKGFRDYAKEIRDATNEHTTAMRANAKEAIATAFASAKELANQQRDSFSAQITKSESSANLEIQSIKALISAKEDKTNEAIVTLSSRLDRGEGGHSGGRAAIDDSRASIATMVGIGGALISLLTLVVLGLSLTHSSSPSVGADTNRVTDLISQMNATNSAQDARFNALSNRINQLSPAVITPPGK